jgi:hypothetical protein
VHRLFNATSGRQGAYGSNSRLFGPGRLVL